jgi:hypothetical protein
VLLLTLQEFEMRKPWKVAPLQHVVAEEITDPAEIAAIDRALAKRKRRRRQWHVAPLQHVVAEEITDPAEIAALERTRQRAKRKRRRSAAKTTARSRTKKKR